MAQGGRRVGAVTPPDRANDDASSVHRINRKVWAGRITLPPPRHPSSGPVMTVQSDRPLPRHDNPGMCHREGGGGGAVVGAIGNHRYQPSINDCCQPTGRPRATETDAQKQGLAGSMSSLPLSANVQCPVPCLPLSYVQSVHLVEHQTAGGMRDKRPKADVGGGGT